MRPPFFGLIYNSQTKEIEYDLTYYPGFQKTYIEIAREILFAFIEKKSYTATLDSITSKYPSPLKGHNRDIPRSDRSLRRWIASPYVRGNTPIQSRIIYDTHLPLINSSQIKVLDQIISTSRHIARYSSNPLMGKVFCAKCQNPLQFISRKQGKYQSFVCRGGLKKSCSQGSISLNPVLKSVIGKLIEQREAIASWAYDQPHLQGRGVAILEGQLRPLIKMDSRDQVDIFESLKSQVKSLKRVYDPRKVQGLAKFMAMPEFWGNIEVSEQQSIFGELIDKVWCDDDHIIVKLRLD